MKNYRLSKGTTEHYTSLDALREGWGMKPVVKKTSDVEKLAKQQESFVKRHICRACGLPMAYIDGNVMTCRNPECKGIEVKREDKDGNEITTYLISYEILGERGAEIANNIFN